MGTTMFKIGNFEAELASTMEKELVTNKLDNKYSFNKVSKAADYINAAAELLDDTGFITEAKLLIKVMERLASEEEVVELSDDDLDELMHGKKEIKNMSIDEMISDPLEQKIIIDYDGSVPLVVNHDKGTIEPEYIDLASLADRFHQKYAKKKI